MDGEAVVLGPDGLSRFDELRRREAARGKILYAFDLIERGGKKSAESPVPLTGRCSLRAQDRSEKGDRRAGDRVANDICGRFP
jgi:hypothetical protein